MLIEGVIFFLHSKQCRSRSHPHDQYIKIENTQLDQLYRYISVYGVKSQISTKCGHIRVCAFVRSNTVKYFTLQEPEPNCRERKGMGKQNSSRSDCSRKTISANHLLIHFMDFSNSLSRILGVGLFGDNFGMGVRASFF